MDTSVEIIVEDFVQRLEESKEKFKMDIALLKLCMAIFLNWPTGSGKTYTVNHEIEDLAVERGWKMVFLCNRRSLKNEILENRRVQDALKGRMNPFCEVMLYQEIERNSASSKWKREILADAQLIICDECHYFTKDALFNPNTIDSLDFIISLLPNSCIIFMSATMDVVKPIIIDKIQKNFDEEYRQWEEKDKERQSTNDELMREVVEELEDPDEEIPYTICMVMDEYAEADRINFELLDDGEEASWNPPCLDGIGEGMGVEYIQPRNKPTIPIIKYYEGIKDVSEHYVIHTFSDDSKMIEEICSDKYHGKTMVFVTSKKRGIKLRDKAAEIIGRKKVMYIDADYDSRNDEKAAKEMNRMTKKNKFKAKILVVTPIVDNGINLHDQEINNIVILCEDEIDWKQMIGRRRVKPGDKVNVFISGLSVSHFKKRFGNYLKKYWNLCKLPKLSFKTVYRQLRNGDLTLDDLTHSYIEYGNWGLCLSKLTFKELHRRLVFCYDTWHKMEEDPDYFLKMQYGWVGQNPDNETIRQSLIEFSEDDEAEISEQLLKYETEWSGIIPKEEFDQFKSRLLSLEAKINKIWCNKVGNLDDVNKILSNSEKWQHYSFISHKLGVKQYYEIIVDGKTPVTIRETLSKEDLEDAVRVCDDVMTDEAFEMITGYGIPKCFGEAPRLVHIFLNEILKTTEKFATMQIKNQGGKGLALEKRSFGKSPSSKNG